MAAIRNQYNFYGLLLIAQSAAAFMPRGGVLPLLRLLTAYPAYSHSDGGVRGPPAQEEGSGHAAEAGPRVSSALPPELLSRPPSLPGRPSQAACRRR